MRQPPVWLLCPPTWGCCSIPISPQVNSTRASEIKKNLKHMTMRCGERPRMGSRGVRVESPDTHTPVDYHLMTECDMWLVVWCVYSMCVHSKRGFIFHAWRVLCSQNVDTNTCTGEHQLICCSSFFQGEVVVKNQSHGKGVCVFVGVCESTHCSTYLCKEYRRIFRY